VIDIKMKNPNRQEEREKKKNQNEANTYQTIDQKKHRKQTIKQNRIKQHKKRIKQPHPKQLNMAILCGDGDGLQAINPRQPYYSHSFIT
jgi:hypothetical protein